MFSNVLRKRSFTRQAEASRLDHIVLVNAKNEAGENAWFYVLVDQGKLNAFLSNQGMSLMNIHDYGRILYSGIGSQPSDLIKWHMHNEYGFTE
jgi:hypothetical protein